MDILLCAHNAYNVQRPEKGDALAGRDAVNADVHHSPPVSREVGIPDVELSDKVDQSWQLDEMVGSKAAKPCPVPHVRPPNGRK